MNSLFRMLIVALFVGVGFCAPAMGQVIDLFENQDSMPVSAVEGASGEGVDGTPTIENLTIQGADGPRLDGGIRLPFVRERGTIFVEARVQGQPHLFILDTGASMTTLTTSVARAARIEPGPQSPRVLMQTASGVMEARQGIVERFELGNRTLRKVTFTICDPCGALNYQGRPVAGLLGMNVLSRYRMSLDDSRGILELVPSSGFGNQWPDIEPWLAAHYLGHRYTSVTRGEVTVRMMVANRSPYPITDVGVELTCRSETGSVASSTGRIARVMPGRPAEVDVKATIAACEEVETRIVEAKW